MDSTKVACAICGRREHILHQHLLTKHDMQPIVYLETYPGSQLWSQLGYEKLRQFHTKPSTRENLPPRPRRTVPMRELFPDFGLATNDQVTGTYDIFDTRGTLTPDEDPDYIFPEKQTLTVLAMLEKPKRNRVYIKGWSGTGKTKLVYALAAKLNAELLEWNADAFMQRSTLLGHWTVVDGETRWIDGILPRALRQGTWLLANEIDTIDPNTMNILKPVLEDPPRLVILENDGEVLYGHPDFRFIATANTWALGDTSGMFVNTHKQSDADVRRWSARVLLDYPTEDNEHKIIKRAVPKLADEKITKIIDVAKRVREAFANGRIDKTLSPAELVNWAENYVVLGSSIFEAARVSFLDALPPDAVIGITDMISAVFGSAGGTAKKIADVSPY